MKEDESPFDDRWRLPRPEEAVPIDGDEFMLVFSLAMSASGLWRPVEHPSQYGITFRQEDGSLIRYVFTDDPMNRAGLAMKEHFGEHRTKFASALMRFFAFIDLWRRGKLDRWIRRSSSDRDSKEVHSSVLETCAWIPLTRSGKLPLKRFLREVERRAQESEDWEEPTPQPVVSLPKH